MKKFIIIASIILGFYACSSDDTTPENNTAIQINFYALTVGNSWVYKYYKLNSETNTFEFNGVTESVSIVGEESVFGDLYFKMKSIKANAETNEVTETYSYVREYEGFLVNEANEILFVNNNYSQQIVRNLGDGFLYGNLQSELQEISVNNENLSCQEFVVTAEINGETIDYIQRYYYSEGIGLVKHSAHSFEENTPTEPFHIERRLESYTVQ